MPVLNVNTTASVRFAKKLEDIHKRHLPKAVKETLNDAAFHLKMKDMQLQAKKTFVERDPRFFKAMSKVIPAVHGPIETLKAEVGFTRSNFKSSKTDAVNDLEQQEHGGRIKNKQFIPKKPARVSKSDKKKVRSAFRLKSGFGNIIRHEEVEGVNWGQRLIKSAVIAKVGGVILTSASSKSNSSKDVSYLWKVENIRRMSKGNTKVRLKLLYTFRENRSVQIHATNFMRTASFRTAKHLPKMFQKHAENIINRHLGI